ncbi:peptide chain release factor 1 [Cylindrobasidium torrendii FP15055 ss-10]|uniref:Peptide chain release factor 1 n=1 Tax=Cylindrobasidium torrendii FP15055 ss-10 TaxID=1314674 RepID=A0A0D7AYI0_9AGAR|nr:peptide chain release factor 1 [Cylindrobasidium torrendii FP15055 ss-10]
MSTPEDIASLRILKETEPLREAWERYTKCNETLDDTRALLDDPDETMRSMASEEYNSVQEEVEELVTDTLPALLIPPSPTGNLGALIELKAGVGGAESCLFVVDLLRMYQRFLENSDYKYTMVSTNEIEQGGIRDALMEVSAPGAYDLLRWESGVHRVQRVPHTEASGRVHTSTVAVIVLPLVTEQEAQSQQLYRMEDVRIEVMRARGAGGQHVNKTESAVRLTHVPSGITVSMQDERSQHQNRRRAFQVLQARLMDQKVVRDMADKRAAKNNLVSGVDRSDKIRTYNYAQERVTDHRIGLSLMNLSSVLEGDGLGNFLTALQKNYRESLMEQMLQGN